MLLVNYMCSSICFLNSTARKSLRRSTTSKSAEIDKRRKERDDHDKRLKDIAQRKNMSDVRRITQEELLEEAKQTEIINLKSLGSVELLGYALGSMIQSICSLNGGVNNVRLN